MKVHYQGPQRSSISVMLEEEIHLLLSCHSCYREVRLTPTEGAQLFGLDADIIDIERCIRCSWCGARRPNVDARPCSQDVSAKRQVFDAERMVRLWPSDPTTHISLQEARSAWTARRPRDSMDFMCNAFRLKTPINQIETDLRRLGLPPLFANGATPNDWPEIEMTRPTNVLPAFRPADVSNPSAGLVLTQKRWWMVPFFHRGETKAWKAMCTNARAESVATSRTFKGPFERRRALIPADGYYEWTGEKGDKIRWLFERPDGDWWSFAGIWDRAETAEGMLESFAIITTEAGPDSASIHNRQPVILEKGDFARWLDLSADVTDLLTPSPSGSLVVLNA